MEIETTNAAEYFFQNPTFTQIYSEAVTNSLDAGATEISIKINIKSYQDADTLHIEIKDNGEGFTDESLTRFKKLLAPKDERHKGLGRLVFLRYFKFIKIESDTGNKLRKFTFSSNFDGTLEIDDDSSTKDSYTKLQFKHFTGKKVKSYSYLTPKEIKDQLLIELLPRFYSMKQNGKTLSLEISLDTKTANTDKGFHNDTQVINLKQLPTLTVEKFSDPTISILDEVSMSYIIDNKFGKNSLNTSVCVDDRTIELNLIPQGALPPNHSAIFLFSSAYFAGKSDPSRQKLCLNDDALETSIRRSLRNHVARIIAKEIPEVEKKNESTKLEFENKFPHLLGYFDEYTIGLIQRDDAIEIAQRRFFKDQKEILQAEYLSDLEYTKSLKVSSRILTEYILYRNLIIKKLKSINDKNSEADIHELIVPRYTTYSNSNLTNDVYNNNAWLLDDKFMTYTTILSESKMDNLIKKITLKDDQEKDDGRPDISIIFSDNPEDSSKVDAVIIELKKRTTDIKENTNAINQLLDRAEKLVETCPNIQRMWYYAVLEVDEKLSRRLKQQKWSPLYSKETIFYQEFEIESPTGANVLVPIFVLSFDSIINDAEARNKTFLELLKDGLIKSSK